MGTGLFEFIAQGCQSLAATAAPSITAMGVHIVLALATIMMVWFGVQEALASAHGEAGFSMGRFFNLFMLLTFAYVMVNYYDSSIPGLGFSIKGFIDGGTTNLVSVIVTDNGTPNLSATNNFKVIVNPVSRPSLGMVLYSGKQLSFTAASGTVGPDYVVEVSTNLAGWQTWLTNNSPPQPFTFTDTTVSTAPAKFYRVRLAP